MRTQLFQIKSSNEYISIKHMIPAGGDDAAKVDGDIRLIFALGGEPFVALNSTQREAAEAGEVVYVDNKEVLCRRWNWRECDKTKMTEETKEVFLVLEGLPPVTPEEIQETIEELSHLLMKHCGAETQIFILNETRSEVEI